MLKKTITAGMLSAGLLTAFVPQVHAEQLTMDVSRVTIDVAAKVAMAAVKACDEKGIPVTATVVDRNGIVQAQLRDTMAPPVSISISQKKAYTAVMFNANGSQLTRQAEGALPTLGEGLAFMAGSVTISAGGKLFGAVGVSGAPDGMVDEECAAAGVAAVIDDLEMM
jgi:uncharacterized protein GlcG (DUF336 family)